MPRRKPTSTRQKKADMQLKRAIKRGDVTPPPPPRNHHHTKNKTVKRGISGSATALSQRARLQSQFIKLPSEYLEGAKFAAAAHPLRRPIPRDIGTQCQNIIKQSRLDSPPLSCPRRPKWRFDMSKKEVEANEEGIFRKWLAQIEQEIERWQEQNTNESIPESLLLNPRSPSYFERNLDVWRQLWRVTEISQILLVLLDSRCPFLHYPPSLAHYLSSRKVVLVLTKVDLAGLERVEAWKGYFHHHHPQTRVVEVESYKQTSVVHGKTRHEPCLSSRFRASLIRAVKELHEELLIPPEHVQRRPELLAEWKPPVKPVIDWNAALQEHPVRTTPAQEVLSVDSHEREDSDRVQFLSIGLIGQPNVGKSSLLNALFGTQKVRASKTPGKTKHLQTLFLTPDIRLVDCPGLVLPNYVPMELQALSGILPISRISAIPSCIYLTSQLLPLERIYRLEHPSLSSSSIIDDRRTWRDGMKPKPEKKEISWTAMDVLVAYANAKGWVTAKAGRPDVNRAGNSILRALAEGKIGWGFWPPDTEATEEPIGIWIPGAVYSEQEQTESDQFDPDSPNETLEDTDEGNEHDTSSENEDANVPLFGRFAMLGVDDERDSLSDEE